MRAAFSGLCLALIGALLVSGGTAPAGSETAPASGGGSDRSRVAAVRVAAAGDVACRPGEEPTRTTCRQPATARLIRRLDVAKVLALGDLQYEDGSNAGFLRSYDASWGDFKDRTLPVPGNHEYKTSGARGYYRYFGDTTVPTPGYSVVTVGAWKLYLLNSNCDEIDCVAERGWFDAAMAADPSECTAMVMHHPRYSSGLEHGSDASLAPFWKIAYAHHVDLALAGHDHDYERFAPMDAHRHVRARRGITSFVVGTGGKSLYHRGSRAAGTRYFRADKFGVLLLTLREGAFSWRFRTISGTARDAGSRACR
ncbi:putative Alkaline phosphatase [metagenome]|uniref:Putative Alkaline phosphatase n=1 Tax=metagenome TaxID=256318 RepID=A0A2P2BWC7_9ZZZZ